MRYRWMVPILLSFLFVMAMTNVTAAQTRSLDDLKRRFGLEPKDYGGDASHRRIPTKPYPTADLLKMLNSPEVQKLLKNALPKEEKQLEKLRKDLQKLVKDGITPELRDTITKRHADIQKKIMEMQRSSPDDSDSGFLRDLMQQFDGLDNLQEFRERHVSDPSLLESFLDQDTPPKTKTGKSIQTLLDRVKKQTGTLDFGKADKNAWKDWLDIDISGAGDSFLDSFRDFGTLLPGLGPAGASTPASGLGHPAFGALLLLLAISIGALFAWRHSSRFLQQQSKRVKPSLQWVAPLATMDNRKTLSTNYQRLTAYLLGPEHMPLSPQERCKALQSSTASDPASALLLHRLFELAYYTPPDVTLTKLQYEEAAAAMQALSKWRPQS